MTFPFHTPLDGVGLIEIPASGITSNVYVLGPPGDAALVDCSVAGSAPEIITTLEEQGHPPDGVKAIVITHGHSDHFGGAAALAEWSGAPVWAHLAAAGNIEDHWSGYIAPGAPGPNAEPDDWERARARSGKTVRVARMLREGDRIELGGLRLDVVHTPGHERGLITLFERRRHLAFVGDLVQGGIDCSANWLGLFTDVAGQRRSLARLAALRPAWLFKGHRQPRTGTDVDADIGAAMARLDVIEEALLDTLEHNSPVTIAQAARATFSQVLGMKEVEPVNYAVATVTAFFLDLAQRGRARRNADRSWELAGK